MQLTGPDTYRALFDLVRQAWEDRPRTETSVIRVGLPFAAASPCDWLTPQTLYPKLFVGDRDDRLQMAAIGAADRLAGAAAPLPLLQQRMNVVLQHEGELKYFGGFRFDPHAEIETCWAPFGGHLLFVPRFEFHVRDGRGMFVCNVVCRGNDDPAAVWQAVEADFDRLPERTADTPRPLWPAARRQTDHPAAAGWKTMVDEALHRIEHGRLQKVVLARVTELELGAPVTACDVLKRLHAATPGCFHFLLAVDREHAFLGATPEMLFYRRDRDLEAAAIAGTRRRGETPETDRRLAAELLSNDKERREHGFVVNTIRDALQPFCVGTQIEPQATVLKLAEIQHLSQVFRGRLEDGVADADLLAALHPTPAVGGVPTVAALSAIRELERFDRGWYAAPLGWFGQESGGFAVGIRSGLLTGRILRLYAGAGIVAGSDPRREWDELENKLAAFLRVFSEHS